MTHMRVVVEYDRTGKIKRPETGTIMTLAEHGEDSSMLRIYVKCMR